MKNLTSNTTLGAQMDAMKVKATTLSKQEIVGALMKIGGGKVSDELWTVRTSLPTTYEDLFGGDEADMLLDELGM